MKRRGFTLVELLVVISIIALLLAVLMPALNKARQQGRTLVCIANLKQQTMFALLFAQTNGNRMPVLYNSSEQRWPALIQGQDTKANLIWVCPSTASQFKKPAQYTPTFGPDKGIRQTVSRIQYSLNSQFSKLVQIQPITGQEFELVMDNHGHSTLEAKNPSTKIILFCCATGKAAPASYPGDDRHLGTACTVDRFGFHSTVHGNSLPFSMLDGHAERLAKMKRSVVGDNSTMYDYRDTVQGFSFCPVAKQGLR